MTQPGSSKKNLNHGGGPSVALKYAVDICTNLPRDNMQAHVKPDFLGKLMADGKICLLVHLHYFSMHRQKVFI